MTSKEYKTRTNLAHSLNLGSMTSKEYKTRTNLAHRLSHDVVVSL